MFLNTHLNIKQWHVFDNKRKKSFLGKTKRQCVDGFVLIKLQFFVTKRSIIVVVVYLYLRLYLSERCLLIWKSIVVKYKSSAIQKGTSTHLLQAKNNYLLCQQQFFVSYVALQCNIWYQQGRKRLRVYVIQKRIKK